MAVWDELEWEIRWLNPEGWVSGFRAHDDAPCFLVHRQTEVAIPWAFIW